jgi:S-adenosylmethionine:tRNA ribosyltransferase-isomerase
LKTKDFDYYLPEELIAQKPLLQRDASRLLVYDRKSDSTDHRHFYDVVEYLKPGDVLVLNNTRVLPARLFGVKRGTARHVEFLLLNRKNARDWEVILKPGKKLKPGDIVDFAPILSAEIKAKKEDGVVDVTFQYEGVFEAILDELGQMPLPPYITEKLEDKTRYQTVYAKIDGSAAAPTAGLHFTPELLEKIKGMGVRIVYVLLHVGLGTFRPVKTEDIGEHIMHSEYFSVSPEAAEEINSARAAGGRVVAVGTTCVRTLESASRDGKLIPQSGNTDIFIYPGYKFNMVDCLITNFHLPKSTLVMLVSAFAGREKTLKLYKMAVEKEYRFFSFGDAMMIL